MSSKRQGKDTLAPLRLAHSRLVGAPFSSPEAAVEWFGAVQAQDFSGAKWALAQRVRDCNEARADEAFRSGKILRTHVLRPTWHFVRPADIRFLLELSAARVKRVLLPYDRKLAIDAALLRKSHASITKALLGGHFLTREELAARLARAGIEASGQRLAHLVMHAELDAVVVSGPRRGKQFTYALFDERVPASKPLTREEALAALAERYFTSHGPASAQDFAWWSGLTVTDAKRAAASAGKRVTERTIGDKTYFGAFGRRPKAAPGPIVRLLPNYDECVIAFKDYTPVLDPALRARMSEHRAVFAQHLVVVDGLVVGGWRREIEKSRVRVEVTLLSKMPAQVKAALAHEAERFASFLGLTLLLELSVVSP